MGRASRSKRERTSAVGKPTGGEIITDHVLDDASSLLALAERLGDLAPLVIGAAQATRVGVDLSDENNDEDELRAGLPLAWFGGPSGTFEIGRDGEVRRTGWRTA